MFCTQCGNKLDDGDQFCGMCGAVRVDGTEYWTPDAPSSTVDEESRVQASDPQPNPFDSASVAAERPAHPESLHDSIPTPSVEGTTPQSPQPNRKTTLIAVAILAAAIAVAAAVVLGTATPGESGDPANSSSTAATTSSSSATQAGDTASSSQSDKESQSSEKSQPSEKEQSSDRLHANGYSFELPDYWKGKVLIADTNDGVVIYPDTALGAVEGYELVTLKLVSADEPENAGDYVTHVAGRVRGDGVRVDVISRNWPAFYAGDWYHHPNYAGSSQEQELASALIDLSSGGEYSYGDVRSAAQNATNDADAYSSFMSVDVDFLNETLIPTVKLDVPDTTSGDNSAAPNLSDLDYETIAQTFSLEMFTSAENTDAGGMRWIGCDRALALVESGSDAEECDFWEDTTTHVYLRIATDATITKTADPGHYQVQVVYESALDATGANRRANIANIEVWINEYGYVEDIEIVSLG